jgi:hypothetical protein
MFKLSILVQKLSNSKSFGSDRIRIHNTRNVTRTRSILMKSFSMRRTKLKVVVSVTRKCLNVGLQAGGILGAVELEQAGLVVLRLEPGGRLVQPSSSHLPHLFLLHADVVLLLLEAVLLFRVRLIVVAVVELVSDGGGGGLITEDDTARVVQRCAVLCL